METYLFYLVYQNTSHCEVVLKVVLGQSADWSKASLKVRPDWSQFCQRKINYIYLFNGNRCHRYGYTAQKTPPQTQMIRLGC